MFRSRLRTATFGLAAMGAGLSVFACGPSDLDEGVALDRVIPEGEFTPIVFIPTDKSVTEAELASVRAAFEDVKAWYGRELGDHGLRMSALQVVRGQHDSAYYLENNRIWAVAGSEIQASLGFDPWARGHAAVVIGAGLLGWAGGNGDGTRGLCIVGLESLFTSPECASQWWCTPEMWRGTVIHEMGHVFSLPHRIDPSI